MRVDGRAPNQLRPITIEPNYMKYAEGSALIIWGQTKVVCTASWEPKVPPWLMGTGQGWITAEYAMLPRSSAQRIQRDINKGKQAPRSVEIQRLIGRAIRSVIDMEVLGQNTITIDCDVIQADGGTRVASIVGGFIATVLALKSLNLRKMPITRYLGAVSLGIVDNEPYLDLCYEEDSRAQADMNLVTDSQGRLSEIQATAEISTFSMETFQKLMELGKEGIEKIIDIERQILGSL